MESNYWARLNRRRLSRRTLLAAGGTAALGVGAAAVVGCGGGGITKASPTPRIHGDNFPTGGSIAVGRPLPVLGLDPHIDLTALDIDTLLYSYLYSWNGSTGEAVFNNFAESVEMPSPDQTEFIFQLRRGVKIQKLWDNPAAGGDLTSRDCLESFIRRSTAITAPDKRFPLWISNSRTDGRPVGHDVILRENLDASSPYRFSIRMRRPFVPAVQEMANPTWAIMPAEVTEPQCHFGSCGFASRSWGSGPFMLVSFQGEERIVLRRHPEYFLAPRPWLHEINYQIITDLQAMLDAFGSRQIDVIPTLSRAEAEDRMKDKDVVVTRAPSRFYPVIHFKIHPRLPFGDVRVREAVDLALDREEMISRIWAGDGNYNGPVPWHLDRFSLSQEELRAAMPHDVDRAKRLMLEAGHEDGLKVAMKVPRMPGVPSVGGLAALIKEQVGMIGIELVIEEVEPGTFIANGLLPGNFDLALFPQMPYAEPDRPLSFYHTRGVTGTVNWNSYTNKDIDKLIDAQAADFNEETRIETILKVQRMILKQHGPQLTLPGGYLFGAHWNHVHNPFGYFPGIDGADQTRLETGPTGTDTWREDA